MLIHKITLDYSQPNVWHPLVLPADFVPLHFANQHERPALWYKTGKEADKQFLYMLVETGKNVDCGNAKYLSTASFDRGRYVLHLFIKGA